MEYLRINRFSAHHVVTQGEFDKFWEWVGPFFHKLRYQRHLAVLWRSGLIGGFLGREESEMALQGTLP